MNIALIGYGKMGRLVEQKAKEKGINVVATIDPDVKDAQSKEITEESLKDVDVCIDFTHPTTAIDNLKKTAVLKRNMVMATTGWYDKMDEARKIVNEHGIGLIWSGNFSIGVNIFFRIIEEAAKIFNRFPDYDALCYELHHNRKADSPSGTAEMVGRIILENLERKDTLVFEKLSRKILPNELHVGSIRGGDIPGTHVVSFDSAFDTIELRHTARLREGFALGAIMAAEFIKKQKGFFGIDDLMRNIIGGV